MSDNLEVINDKVNTEKSGIVVALLLTIITSVGGFALSGHFPVGNKIYLYGDYYFQYMEFIKLFWRELLSGQGLSYSFSASMGQPTSLLYAYYCLSPCNVFFAFISDPDLAAYLVMLSKQILASVFFFLFCSRVLKIRGMATALFSAFYAQCGHLCNYFSHINLIDSLYLLPLILLVLWRFVKSGRWHELCIVYALSFVICFYGGYQTGIFSFLFFLIFMYSLYGRPSGVWKNRIQQYFICVMIAVLLSMVVILPAAMQLLSDKSESITEYAAQDTHIWDIIATLFMGRNYGTNGKTPMLYSGVLVFFALPTFLLSKKVKKIEKMIFLIPFVFLLLCTFVKPIYMFIHGFDLPDGNYFRFAYMFSFLLAALGAWLVEKRDYKLGSGVMRPLIVLVICSVSYILIAFLQRFYPIGDSREGMTIFGMEYNAIFLAVYGVLLYGKIENKQVKILILLIVGVIENILNAGFSNMNDDNGLERRKDYYCLWTSEGQEALEKIKDLQGDENDFYRIRYENVFTPNNAAYWGYHGIGYFSSVEQPELKKFMYRMGYFVSEKAWMEDYGGTPLTQALFAQKYIVHGTNPKTENEEAYYVKKNDGALPMAYMVSDKLKDYHADQEDPFLNQENLVSAMLDDETDIFVPYQEAPAMYTENVQSIWFNVGQGWGLTNTEGGDGYILMEITGKDQPAYCYFSQSDFFGYNDSARLVTEKDGGTPIRVSYLFTPHIMEMGKNARGNYSAGIIIDNPKIPFANYNNSYFYYLDEQSLDEALERLRLGGVVLSEQKDHIITGEADTAGGLLFTSIPYDAGWEAYVDGASSPVIPVCDGAFLAMEIPAGNHRIELRYVNRWIRYGGILSMLGGGLLLASFARTRRKKQAPASSEEEKAD